MGQNPGDGGGSIDVNRIVTGYLAIALAMGGTAVAEEARPVLTVSGTGTSKAKPDVARFVATVTTRAPDLDAAANAHGERAAKATALLGAMRDKGVKVERSAFSLRVERIDLDQPRAPGGRGARQTEGVATTRYDVEVRPVDAIDDVVTALALNGTLEVLPATYVLDDPKAETDKARALAMADALDQAKVFSKAGGFRLGEIVNVAGGGMQVMDAYPMAGAQAMRSMAAAPMQASAPATLDTQATVGVTWRIKGADTTP